MNITTLLAFASFIISIYTLYRQRKHLTITFPDNFYLLETKKHVFFNGEPYPAQSKYALYGSIDIVNSSHMNMSYFDLRCFSPHSNKNHFLATQRTVLPTVGNDTLLISPYGIDNPFAFFVKLPLRKFGALPAGSYTSIDVLIFINEEVDLKSGLMLSLKATDTSIFHRSKYSDTNRCIYRAHEKLYDMSVLIEALNNNRSSDN